MKFGKAFIFVIMCLLLIGMAVMFILICGSLIDAFTSEEVGTEMVPCMDRFNRPFENEMCEKTITCSKFGLWAEYKCSSDYIKDKLFLYTRNHDEK